MTDTSNMSIALSYVARGWHVAPVNVNYLPTGKKKVEFLVPWGSAASNDEETVRDWYVQHPHAGIAIATKPSRIVGIDLDVIDGESVGLDAWLELLGEHNGGEWLDTYGVNTPGGGLHLYFNDPDNRACNSASSLRPGIDVRGGGASNGGVLFAPPTSTAKGTYSIYADVPLLDCPEWLWALIEKPRRPAPDNVGRSILDEQEEFTGEPAGQGETLARVCVLAQEIAALDGPGGNQQAARIAFMAGQYAGAGQLPISEVIATLVAPLFAWEAASGQESTWHATIHNQVREGAKHPRPWGAAKKARASRPVDPEFTDASMAEYLADELLRGRYVRTRGLGWLRWTGTHWRQCDDGAAVEAVRAYVKKRLIEAIRKNLASTKDWARYNAAGKITSLVSLAGNMDGILREASEFDQHPDLLNTPAGVLDLTNLEVLEHDPGLLLTKITKGTYRPGHSTKYFDTALEAVPADALDWLRAHFGAGVSGRPKPRVPAVLLTGKGRNGKTMLCETALEALGGIDGEGYAVQVPNELLLLGKAVGGPSPEKLALRGARFAYIEETPEGRYLDVNALKKVIGTGVMSGRDLYKGIVSFRMSHILFINTNFPPRVTETDTATWDRLTALYFPLRYRKENDETDLGPWVDATDRPGLPTLAADLQGQDSLDAMLTWMVDGYRAGRPDQAEKPASVVESVSVWRKEGDSLLRFIEDTFEFDRDSWVTTQSLYAAFRQWSEHQGQQKPPPMNTLISRIKDHTGLKRAITITRVVSTTAGLSVPDVAGYVIEGAGSRVVLGGQATGAFGIRFVDSAVSTS